MAAVDERQPDEPPKRPLFARGWRALWLLLAAVVADSIEGSILTRFLAHAHGWTGATKIILVSILPLVILIYLGGIYSSQLLPLLDLPSRIMVIKGYFLLCAVTLWASPALWRWSGQATLAEHVFHGAGAGVVVGVAVRVYLAVRHRGWFLGRGGDIWRWEQRLMLTGFALLGGCVTIVLA